MKTIATYTLAAWTPAVFAHEKAGLEAIHWHATDLWGLLTVAALAGVAVWLSRGRK
jgi:hypothetical protein